ncbi:DNA mismatch endonuclease Vsr [Mucilaginibacter terrigena]|uniref:Very short patch repair endonuclease n=1 Tax=Mucilaginibacter terrigena TaxID=2492395 RepID=A0A4Q5LJH9_9SPHI|nr:very short patch repair endonuclease [Mucilaginibacter terrigena]RYU89513.1 DNA mismatch endonuclease Vsr [Mucilaginibacter terrigena]
MADVHSKETRSYNMSRIRSKDTKPELLVRKFLHKNGFRYRLHVKDMPGKPDIVLPKYKTVIFIHGCFWHGHEGCKKAALPETRREWWETKINYNNKNDVNVEALLKAAGWNIITIWQCDMKKSLLENTFNNLLENLRQIS